MLEPALIEPGELAIARKPWWALRGQDMGIDTYTVKRA
jgi:hypothetical protein